MKNRILIAAFVFILSSCYEEIQVDIPWKEKIIVNALFAPDNKYWIVSLTLNHQPLNKSPYRTIDDATVTLYENEAAIETLTKNKNGLYVSRTQPVVGQEYELWVDSPQYGKVKARSTAPLPVMIMDVSVIEPPIGSGEDATITIKFQDTPSETNYYQILVDWEWPQGRNPQAQIYSEDPAINLKDEYGTIITSQEGLIFKDTFFDGQETTMTFKAYISSHMKQIKKLLLPFAP